MTRFILRTVLTSAALLLLFAGSFNLSRTRAELVPVDDGGGDAAVSECEKYTGCKGGPNLCGVLHYPNGPDVECGKS